MNELVALVGFAFVGSVTPGPNNTVLWASGLRFGFPRTVPHVLGTSIGIGTMVLGVAGGIGFLVTAVPGAELVLKSVAPRICSICRFGSPAGGRSCARPSRDR